MNPEIKLIALSLFIAIILAITFWGGVQFGVDVQKQMAFDGLRGVVFNDTAAKQCTMQVENMTAYIHCSG